GGNLRAAPVPVFLMVAGRLSPELRQVTVAGRNPLRESPVPVFLMGKPGGAET
ncbi:hypothetical protein TNCV_1633161, partial [Trichonephila clavipes]